jgi:hypothetical protein
MLNRRGWDGLNWDGAEVAIMAGGESMLTEGMVDAVLAWHCGHELRRVIVINTTWRLAPWADVLYACDGAWWKGRDRTDAEMYVNEAKARFGGQLWTQDVQSAETFGLKLIRSTPGRGLERKIGIINQGANGGYQAIGLAYQAGARRCFLLGYDMHGRHWHGQHPGLLHRNQAFPTFLKNFQNLAADIAGVEDFEVINCTPKSLLRAFPMRPWQEVFA